MGKPTILYCNYSTSATATPSLVGNGNGSDVLIETEDTYYAPLATSSFSIVIDVGASTAFDSFAIVGAYLNGTTVEVRGSTDNFATSDVSISAATALTSDVNSAWRSFTTGTYRYWKFLFSGHPSNLRVAHVCLVTKLDLPYFETDPDIRNFNPTAVQLVSQSGIYIGNNQQKSMRDMSLNWGEVTQTELTVIQAFAESCIKVVKPFTFIPDIDETNSFFGWIPNGGSFSSPETPGVFSVNNLQFVTRAV